jgi:hypothetical protein
MAKTVSCWPLIVEVRFLSEVGPCEICGGQRSTGTVFMSEYIDFPLSVSLHHCFTLIFIYMLFLREDKRVRLGNITKSKALSEIGERWMEKYFHLSFKGLMPKTLSP